MVFFVLMYSGHFFCSAYAKLAWAKPLIDYNINCHVYPFSPTQYFLGVIYTLYGLPQLKVDEPLLIIHQHKKVTDIRHVSLFQIITSSVLYMPMITPPSLKLKASIRVSALPSDGVKTSSNLPGLVTT